MVKTRVIQQLIRSTVPTASKIRCCFQARSFSLVSVRRSWNLVCKKTFTSSLISVIEAATDLSGTVSPPSSDGHAQQKPGYSGRYYHMHRIVADDVLRPCAGLVVSGFSLALEFSRFFLSRLPPVFGMRSRLAAQFIYFGPGCGAKLAQAVVSIFAAAGLLQPLANVAEQSDSLAGY